MNRGEHKTLLLIVDAHQGPLNVLDVINTELSFTLPTTTRLNQIMSKIASFVGPLVAGVAVGLSVSHVLPCTYKYMQKKAAKKQKLTLYYFPIPALGEPIRLLLELGG